MRAEDIQTGMILNWQSTTWPSKKSRWLVLEEQHFGTLEGRRFKLYCLQRNSVSFGFQRNSVSFGDLGETSSYVFHNGNMHRFSIHSQI